MDYKLVIKNIKEKKFEKIYFLHGEEPFYIDEITDAVIKNALDDSERDFNQTILYGKDTELLNLISELKSYPMMAERRLVVLKEAQDFKDLEKLDAYLSDPLDTTVFVIAYKYDNYDARKKALKAAASNGLLFKSEKVKEYLLGDWIQTYVSSVGFKITGKACMLLIEFLGNDMGKIVNELDKLAILLEKGTSINEIHIEENIGISKDYNTFELTNAFNKRDVTKAFKIVNYFSHNPKAADINAVIPLVFKYFGQLMRIHFLPNKSKEAVAGALKVHPYVAGELLSASKLYDPKKIAINIAILQEFDLRAKGLGNSSFTSGELMQEMVYRLLH